MAQALSKASAHVSSGDVAERHDRREYVPKNADRSLGGRNVIIHDVGDYREAINAEFREDVLAYNASQKRVERHKSLDYYAEVASSAQQEPVYEFVVGVGSRETCGVCDDPFDDEEFEAAQAADRADGGHRADDYEAAHFDGRRWEAMKAEGREDEASEYVQRHLAKGLKAEAHDKAVAILKDVARALIENRPDPRTGRRPIPKGFKLMMVVLHDDEPCGTPHLHVAVCPIAEGYSRGMRRRIGLAKALEQGGYKGKGAMPELYEHVRQDVMVPIMKAHDVGREFKGNHERHLAVDEFQARRDRERAAERAERARSELAEVRRELHEAEDAVGAARADADAARREAADTRREAGRDLERVHRAKREADRMRARAEVALHGYEPPAGVELVPPAAMPPELRALWRLTDGDEGDDAVYDLPDDLLGEDGEPDLDAANERVVDLADEFARERGYAQAYVDGDGAWLVTPPLEFMRQQDGYEDVESVDELTDDDRLYWSEKWWDEASLRIADAQVLGLDPTVPHPGIDEREAAVEAARADVERRDRVVGEREAAFERLASKRRSVVDALDAEIEARRAEAARLDTEVEETRGWLEGAVEHVKAADAYVERAKADAEATRRQAEADAERTRERARVEAREGVSLAVGDAGAKVSRLVAEFTSTVVGNVCQLAFATLKAMRDNMALGDEFDRAATTCMVTLHQVVEQDRDGSIARAIEGRARDVMNAAFSKRARREVVEPVFADDWEPRPSGRSRDDGSGL
ncbi:hypothetical protein [Thermophilibacter provencensis]|uniref:Uncharacterized protein n=1 Tax=Thermophilibacter provencensis TaxID=1852386 RepID=A0ABT7V758_9ACTN|nr:hypothetical protein [Thermophilibacter provencensis]MDM8271851.1 hypothetical protein [Thermophilibacter provencensis]